MKDKPNSISLNETAHFTHVELLFTAKTFLCYTTWGENNKECAEQAPSLSEVVRYFFNVGCRIQEDKARTINSWKIWSLLFSFFVYFLLGNGIRWVLLSPLIRYKGIFVVILDKNLSRSFTHSYLFHLIRR